MLCYSGEDSFSVLDTAAGSLRTHACAGLTALSSGFLPDTILVAVGCHIYLYSAKSWEILAEGDLPIADSVSKGKSH